MDALKLFGAARAAASAARWHAHRLWSDNPTARAGGLGIGIAGLVLWQLSVPQGRALELAAQQQQRDASHHLALIASEQRFLARFAAEVDPASLTALAQLAQSQGVRMTSVQQSERRLQQLPLRGWVFDMTLHGSYRAIRDFMARATDTFEQLSIESVRFERSEPSDQSGGAVRAQVRWVLWQATVAVQPLSVRGDGVADVRDRAEPKAASPQSLRDLFATAQPANPTLSHPKRLLPKPQIEPALKPPKQQTAPMPDLEYLGQLNVGEGQRAMARVGGKSVLLAVGASVAGGYAVKAMDAQALTLVHAADGVELKISRGRAIQ